jgi:NitT/TauT family transport system ATP-binding protein
MRDVCKVEGEIRVMGKIPVVASKNREIGLILQEPTLLEWRDVSRNISLPLEIMGYSREEQVKEVRKFLKLLDLEKYAKYRPSELSGGMQQKVSIGRALAYDPDVLLMDEPFGALDEINRKKMNDEIIKVWQKTKKTILFITHSIDEAVYLSEKVIVLSEKPSTIHKIVKIKLPYPRIREQNSTRYFKYIKQVRQYLNDATY